MSDQGKSREELEARFEAVYRQFVELQKDCEKQFPDIKSICLHELQRVREQMDYAKEVVFRDTLWIVLSPERQYYTRPTERHLLQAQIARLAKSSHPIDMALLEFLVKTFKAKRYKAKDWRGTGTFGLALDAITIIREKGHSQSMAAKIVAQRSGVSKKRIENEISKVKKILPDESDIAVAYFLYLRKTEKIEDYLYFR